MGKYLLSGVDKHGELNRTLSFEVSGIIYHIQNIIGNLTPNTVCHIFRTYNPAMTRICHASLIFQLGDFGAVRAYLAIEKSGIPFEDGR
jgi:hypothetical protein